jgi:hypothetical protein
MTRKYPYELLKILRSISPGYGTAIFDPANVEMLFKDFFENPNDLWNKYIPFGCNEKKKTVFIYNRENRKAACICDESVIEDWNDGIWVNLKEIINWF